MSTDCKHYPDPKPEAEDDLTIAYMMGQASNLDELRELRKDKARLDWLAVTDYWFEEPADQDFNPATFRAAIDQAMKEEA